MKIRDTTDPGLLESNDGQHLISAATKVPLKIEAKSPDPSSGPARSRTEAATSIRTVRALGAVSWMGLHVRQCFWLVSSPVVIEAFGVESLAITHFTIGTLARD